MKPGTQADVIRELESEHGIKCSRAAISKLDKAKDYRIVKTPKGKIKIAETVKALIDSGFGKRSKSQNKVPAGGDKKATPINGETESTDSEPTKALSIDLTRREIEKHREFQKTRKAKAEADKLNQESVLLDDVVEKIYDTLRPLRDDIQLLHKKIGHLSHAAKTPHESMQIIQKETDRILLSRIGGDFLFDAELKKKIKKILTT